MADGSRIIFRFRQIPSEMRWGNLWAAGGSGNVASTVTYDAYQSIVYPVIDTDDTPKIVDATFGPEGTTPPGSTLDASDDGVVMLTSPYEFVSTAPHRANSLFAAIHEACAGVNRELYRGNPVTKLVEEIRFTAIRCRWRGVLIPTLSPWVPWLRGWIRNPLVSMG